MLEIFIGLWLVVVIPGWTWVGYQNLTAVPEYEVFERSANYYIGKKEKEYKNNIIREDYNSTHYIYVIYNSVQPDIDKRCIYGHITKKNDPEQISIGWAIISGKEYCKIKPKYVFSF